MSKIADIRNEYSREELTEAIVEHSPIKQFGKWFEEALQAEVSEPTAMSLGTATPDGRPSVRIVLLKGFDELGFVFFTNYDSRKGKDISLNPNGALTFFWHALERQVRIEGRIELVSPQESDEYYHSRPEGSRLGAWASPQSNTITREELQERMRKFEEEYKGIQPPRPPFWGGYRLVPIMIEFWQGRPSRLHDRIVYTLSGGKWHISRIAP